MVDSARLSCPECDFTTRKERRLVKHVRKSHGKPAIKCPFCRPALHYSTSAAGVCAHKKLRHRKVRLRCFLCEFSSRSLDRWASHVTESHAVHMPSLVRLAGGAGPAVSAHLLSESRPLSVRRTGVIQETEKTVHAESYEVKNEECLYKVSHLKNEQSVATTLAKVDFVNPDPRIHAVSSLETFQKRPSDNVEDQPLEQCFMLVNKHTDVAEEKVSSVVTLEQKENHCKSCPCCGMLYSSWRDLRQHCKSEHFDGQRFACNSCDYRCRNVSKLVKHSRCHTGEKPFACHICPFKAALQGNLISHIRTHTGEKPFACHLCPYKAAQRVHLTTHIRTHTGEKPFACHICPFKAALQGDLISHIRTHTGEKPFACHLCPYKAARQSTLTSHIRTHTGEKPYACHLCSYKFRHKGYLNVHLRTHTNERPYKCPMCMYAAKNRSTLTIHIRSHTKEKPYECKLCMRRFSDASNLRQHVKNMVCTS